jgi:hypothetical protein
MWRFDDVMRQPPVYFFSKRQKNSAKYVPRSQIDYRSTSNFFNGEKEEETANAAKEDKDN